MKNFFTGLAVITGGAWLLWSLIVGFWQSYTPSTQNASDSRPIEWMDPFWWWFSMTPLILLGLLAVGFVIWAVGAKVRGEDF